MAQPLHRLGGADQAAGAAAHDLALRPHGIAAAFGALVREDVLDGAVGPALRDDADDLRDDVARPLDDDRVADPDVLAPALVLVVERGPAHHDATDGHQPTRSKDGRFGKGWE